jgi:hypothetical protein
MKKEHALIAGLIGVGGIVVIYLLIKEFSTQETATPPVSVPENNQPSYPAASPLQLGNVTVNNAGPPSMVYNTPLDGLQVPTLQVGNDDGTGECCDTDPCETAGVLTTVQTIPAGVLDTATKNFNDYQQKVTFQQSAKPVSVAQVIANEGGILNAA